MLTDASKTSDVLTAVTEYYFLLLDIYGRLRETRCLHLQGTRVVINIYHATRRNIAEDNNLHFHHLKNLKTHGLRVTG
jgi:hypothetical protein